jgi:hypothetical protein
MSKIDGVGREDRTESLPTEAKPSEFTDIARANRCVQRTLKSNTALGDSRGAECLGFLFIEYRDIAPKSYAWGLW